MTVGGHCRCLLSLSVWQAQRREQMAHRSQWKGPRYDQESGKSSSIVVRNELNAAEMSHSLLICRHIMYASHQQRGCLTVDLPTSRLGIAIS